MPATAFDGSVTHTDYDPLTGTVKDTWLDVNGDGAFTPGVDPKSVYDLLTDPSSAAGSHHHHRPRRPPATPSDTLTVSNGGLDSTETIDGMTTTDPRRPLGSGGRDRHHHRPRRHQDRRHLHAGLLTDEQSWAPPAPSSPARASATTACAATTPITDWTGTTT